MEKTGGGGSKLAQIQARFQQRQLLEREQKMVAVYEAQQARALGRVASTGAVAAPPAAPRQPGKVRQMFEERRTKAGIDKSYPLQPIQSNTVVAPRRPLPNGYVKVTTPNVKVAAPRAKVTAEKPPSRPSVNNNSHSIRKLKSEPVVSGAGDVNHNTQPDRTPAKTNGWQDETDATERRTGAGRVASLEDETFPEELAPSPTPRSEPPSPPPRAARQPPVERRSPAAAMAATKSSPALAKSPAKQARPPPRAAPARVTPPRVTPPRRNSGEVLAAGSGKTSPTPREQPTSGAGAMKSARPQATPSKVRAAGSARGGSAAGGGEPCPVCGRRFAADRLERHEEICRRANGKRRKPYDALKHRLAGTEAEPFIRQLRKLPPPGKPAAPSAGKKPLNSTWRQKHEDFVRSIRAARQAQAFVAGGGKLSDLPPPPPAENPDYVQCPHCGRRFNEAAAERHIPKCQNYQYNKKAPSQPARRR